jgi:hypothetical protein
MDVNSAQKISAILIFIPYWWKKPLKQLPATFNARAEGIASKPMFRDAFKRHRCIIPASGYYEWNAKPDGKQPYFITAADGGVLSFAGLWDRWKNSETGELATSCTIIVTDANALARPIHDRMAAAALRTDARGRMLNAFARQMRRQCFAHRNVLGRPRRHNQRRLRLDRGFPPRRVLRLSFFEVADGEFKLLDGAVEFLRRLAETRSPQRRQLHLQTMRSRPRF